MKKRIPNDLQLARYLILYKINYFFSFSEFRVKVVHQQFPDEKFHVCAEIPRFYIRGKRIDFWQSHLQRN